MNYSRRDLLKFGVGAAALCAVGTGVPSLRGQEPKKKIPIALEMWSVRDVAKDDPAGTLAAVGKMGYVGVEISSNPYGRKAEEVRKMLDDANLKCCGMHTGLKTLTGDALQKTVEYNKILGNTFLILPDLPRANLASVAALMDTAKLLTDLAAKAKELGMRIGYHNHVAEFKPVADRIPWEVIFSNAGPDVIMQLDICHCMDGGGDPIAILKKFPHRTATIHLTEHGGPQGAVIGEGDVPWKQVFELCETICDTEWYVVEQERYKPGVPTMESARLCLENLRKMGK
jgi:sugar phosphate isomerase/epimerase